MATKNEHGKDEHAEAHAPDHPAPPVPAPGSVPLTKEEIKAADDLLMSYNPSELAWLMSREPGRYQRYLELTEKAKAAAEHHEKAAHDTAKKE